MLETVNSSVEREREKEGGFVDSAADYAERHHLYSLFQGLLQDLIVNKPEDPVDYLVNRLSKPLRTPKYFVLGNTAKYIDLFANACNGGENIVILSGLTSANEVRARIGKADCLHGGYILVGFPTNRIEAIQLQSAGVLPDKVVFLKESSSSSSFDDRGVRSLLSCYDKSILGTFDVSLSSEIQQLKEFVKIDFIDISPKTPPRFVIIGPPSSGKTTQAEMLENKLGLQRINAIESVQRAIAGDTIYGKQAREYWQSGTPIPDSIVISIIKQETNSVVARRKGWVLEGFPQTEEQSKLMFQSGINPKQIILLSGTTESLADRSICRRVDPLTGETYHTIQKYPDDENIRARLIRSLYDEPATFEKRAQLWQSTSDRLLSSLQKQPSTQITTITAATPSKLSIFEQIIATTKHSTT